MRIRPVALVTGASRGIGAALAVGLAGHGYEVWAVARTRDPGRGRLAGSLRETLAAMRAAGGAGHIRAGDVNAPGFLGQTMAAIAGTSGRPPELVVHAAMTRTGAPLARLDPGTWRECVGGNLDGLFLLARACRDTMRGGSVVVLTSAMADRHRVVPPACLAYATAKAAAERFVTAAAPELAGRDVAFNGLRPGAVRTEYAEAELGPDRDWSGWAAPSDLVGPVLAIGSYRPSRGDPTGQVIAARDLRPDAGSPS
jgi:NAD(P)-dependent dehydrogenase (short-subunit alcohol dehydrogenase family)